MPDPIHYLSLFSGVEAASLAWGPLGWAPVAFAEVEPFPSAVLAHHWPQVPNLGDVTKITDDVIAALGRIDVVVGGSPCQDLSLAGRRAGLAGERSGLFFEQVRIFHAARTLCGARWLVWENVPGALSSRQGRDFGAVAGTLVGTETGVPDGGWGTEGVALGPDGLLEWAVLDAQWFGVAQRRRRVFAVLDAGDWRSRGPVLLEPDGLRGDTAPRREAGKGIAAGTRSRAGRGRISRSVSAKWAKGSGGPAVDEAYNLVAEVSPALTAREGKGATSDAGNGAAPLGVTHTLRGEGFDASEDGTGRGTPLVPVAFSCKDHGADAGAVAPTLRAMSHSGSRANAGGQVAVAFQADDYRQGTYARIDAARPLTTQTDMGRAPLVVGADIHCAKTDALYNEGMSQHEVDHACETEADAEEKLCVLWKKARAEATSEWGLGIPVPLQSSQILRPAMYGEGIRPAALSECRVVDGALSCAENGSARAVQLLREAGCQRRSSQGREPSEQFVRESRAHLSKLPYERTQEAGLVQDLWCAAKRSGVLRQALPAVQEMGRSAVDESESAHSATAIRRLTAKEAERLMGMPDDHTRIAWRGRPAEECPDGPRYTAIGNSMAVPVMRWIGEQIARAVAESESGLEAAHA